MAEEQAVSKHGWAWTPILRDISVSVAAVVTPIVIAFLGYSFNSAVKDRELRVKYVEIAVGILSDEPTIRNSNIRSWAIDVINTHSDVKIGPEAREELIQQELGTTSDAQSPLRTQRGGRTSATIAPSAPADEQQLKTRAPVVTENVQVELPQDIESMWAFYQSRSNQDTSGCRRAMSPEPGRPEHFLRQIPQMIQTTVRNPDIMLVVTAFSRQRQWAAAAEIKINGILLRPMAPYWCNGELNYGYEVPID